MTDFKLLDHNKPVIVVLEILFCYCHKFESPPPLLLVPPFPQAYRKGMIYPQYLYISYYWFSEGWFLDPRSNCTVDEIIIAVNRSIAVDYFPEPAINETDSPTDVGTVSK